MVEQGADGRGGHQACVPLLHGGDVLACGIAAGLDGRHPCQIGLGQAVLGEERGDRVAESRVAVDRRVVEVKHQQRHNRQ